MIKIGLLIVTTTLIGIGTVIANSSSRVLATPAEAKMHLDEGIKALQGGDTNGAMTILKLQSQHYQDDLNLHCAIFCDSILPRYKQ